MEDMPGKPWPEDFPEVIKISKSEEMKAHTDYEMAKSGNRDAAARLVLDILRDKVSLACIYKIAVKYPDAIIVPVHEEEQRGRNQIPRALADFIALYTGLEADTGIVQTKKIGRTGAGQWARMAFRPKFDGPVIPGRKYILVDDVITMGGTLSELRQHIETNGGKVVDIATLGAARNSTIIALNDKIKLELERRYGVDSLRKFLREAGLYGGNYEALTKSEARAILDAGTLDEAGNRIIAARQPGGA